MTTTEMATREDFQIARLDPQALIAQAIEKGAGMDTLERLVALAKEVRAELARRCATSRRASRSFAGRAATPRTGSSRWVKQSSGG